jgi:hypothetical protein
MIRFMMSDVLSDASGFKLYILFTSTVHKSDPLYLIGNPYIGSYQLICLYPVTEKPQ